MERIIRSGGYVEMQTVVPLGQLDDFAVQHYEIDKETAKFSRLRAALNAARMEEICEGKYARLMRNKTLMMSDTYMEQYSNLDFVWKARGDVLIAGLGLGMVLVPVARKPEVSSIVVVEKSPEVIELIWEHIKFFLGANGEKLSIVEADAFEWLPPKGQKFDTVYLDIWDDICDDNLDEVARLKRHFAKRLRRNGDGKHWMGAWQENWLRYERRRNR